MAVSTYEALLASARHGDVDEMRELLKAASAEEKDQMVNYVQEGTLNTPLHMGKRAHRVQSIKHRTSWILESLYPLVLIRSLRQRTR